MTVAADGVDEAARLERLAEQLVTARGARRRLPVVSVRDAAALTAEMHREVDRAIELRAEVAAKAGERIACGRGCAACCHNVVVAREGDAVAVADWLSAPERAAVRTAFLEAYGRWRRALGPRLAELLRAVAGGVRGAVHEVSRRGLVMCPFNAGGDCTIYPVRPSKCRTHHALDSNARCAIDVDETPHQLAWRPLDDLVERQTLVEQALAEAMRPGAGREPLVVAVHRRLTAAGGAAHVGRNDPCPCGSGEVLRRCCGA